MLLDAVLEVLQGVSLKISPVDGIAYLSLTYLRGICMLKVVPTPTVLFNVMEPPIRVASW